MEEKDAFDALLTFGTAGDRNFIKFHKNTGDYEDWKCYFGVYGPGELPLWVAKGRGKTIYASALSAIRNRQEMLRG